MKGSKKQSNISKSDHPDDPCDLCLVSACCNAPCEMLMDYMNTIYDIAERDPNNQVLDRLPRHLKESIAHFVKRTKELNDKYKKDS